MQKLINALAVVSFVGVVSIIGGGAYVYTQRDALIESAKERITELQQSPIAGTLPGMLDAAMPELPEVTGGAMPGVPGGGGLPGF